MKVLSSVASSRRVGDNKTIKSVYRQPSANSQFKPDRGERSSSIPDLKINQTDFTSLVQLYGGSKQE